MSQSKPTQFAGDQGLAEFHNWRGCADCFWVEEPRAAGGFTMEDRAHVRCTRANAIKADLQEEYPDPDIYEAKRDELGIAVGIQPVVDSMEDCGILRIDSKRIFHQPAN